MNISKKELVGGFLCTTTIEGSLMRFHGFKN
jgi:hypothetical protein